MEKTAHIHPHTHKLLFSNFCEVSLDLQAKRGTNELPVQAVIPGPNPYLAMLPLTKPRPGLDGRRSLLGLLPPTYIIPNSPLEAWSSTHVCDLQSTCNLPKKLSNPHTEDTLNYYSIQQGHSIISKSKRTRQRPNCKMEEGFFFYIDSLVYEQLIERGTEQRCNPTQKTMAKTIAQMNRD